jgi:hypothetical protein
MEGCCSFVDTPDEQVFQMALPAMCFEFQPPPHQGPEPEEEKWMQLIQDYNDHASVKLPKYGDFLLGCCSAGWCLRDLFKNAALA